MVKFQCIRSGNMVAFSDPNDIESMRKHEGYKEICHEEKTIQEVPIQVAHEEKVLTVSKQRGRPKKVVVPVENDVEI